jgi:hypothetical protein
VIEKTVERKNLRDGQRPLDVRTNSYGDTVYILPGTEADIRMKQGSEVSKAIRTLAMRMIPRSLVREAEQEIVATMAREDARDPKLAQKKVVEAFASAGIKAAQLEEYLGRTLDGIGPELLNELRCVFAALRDGDATWDDLLSGSPHRKAEATQDGDESKKKDSVKELLQKKADQARAKSASAESKAEQPANGSDTKKKREPKQGDSLFTDPDPDNDGR